MNPPLSTLTTRAKGLKLACAGVAVSVLSACTTVTVAPIDPPSMKKVNWEDAVAIRKDVEPLNGPLTLEAAVARALKYNLDRRARLMEESIALQQLDLTRLDMLPKLVAQAGYTTRDRERATFSQTYNPESPYGAIGERSPSSSFSQEAKHSTIDLGLSWSLLDIGIGQSTSKQAADRVLIAIEKRRKAMHLLMQDVRTVYWRAVSAQKLRDNVESTIKMAEEALVDARKAEAERLRSPLDSLRYQRQLLENLRLLEAIDQELSSAQVELASLINMPIGQPIELAETDVEVNNDIVFSTPIEKLEELALENNADLREQHYNSRTAATEVRKTIVRLFPNVVFNYGIKYDTDSYLVHNNWQEAGFQLSFNLFNLYTGPTQIKLANAGVALADQRRIATQMAVITQLHLARLQLKNATAQFNRADAIYNTDQRITEQIRNRQKAQAQSQLDRVAQEATVILSLLRRYQALAQIHLAENRLIANLGLEPKISSTDELSLTELTKQVKGNPWEILKVSNANTPQ